MNNKGKIILASFLIVIVIAIGVLIYLFYPAIKGSIDGKGYLTPEQGQELYDKGYADGSKNESELKTKINYYMSLVDTLQKDKYSLQDSIKENNQTINELNTQILNLKNQVNSFKNSNEDKSAQITQLNAQISTLQNMVTQLQTTNSMNSEIISSLNTQISVLSNQLSEMSLKSQSSINQIAELNNKIEELEKSITYYETYISNLESDEQVVATFEYDGSVYSIQLVNKGSTLSVATPTSTEYKIFNNWTINGEVVDLSTFTITENTKIIADITYKYDVIFKVDDVNYDSQIVLKNNTAILPEEPTKDGYQFVGWSINGVDIVSDIESKQVTKNVTYLAIFKRIYSVSFIVENEVIESKSVLHGDVVSTDIVPTKENYDFVGWTINGTDVVDLSTYQITSMTNFTALFTLHRYSVKIADSYTMIGSPTVLYEFTVPYGSAIGSIDYIPTKEDYRCIGYQTYSLMASDIDLSTFTITGDTYIVPKWERNVSVVKVYDGDTLLYSHKYTTNDVYSLSTIIPIGREKMRFVGWDNCSDSARIVHFQNETNAPKLLESLGTYTAGNKDVTYYAYYEHLCMGHFESSDGEVVLKLTYQTTGDVSDGFVNHVLCDNSTSYLKSGTYDVESGSYTYTAGNTIYSGQYNLDTDTWTIIVTLGDKNTTYTLSRVNHTCGVSVFNFDL